MKKRQITVTLLSIIALVGCGKANTSSNSTSSSIDKCVDEYCLSNVKNLNYSEGRFYGFSGSSKTPYSYKGDDYSMKMYNINNIDEDIVFADIVEFIDFSKKISMPFDIESYEKEDGVLTLRGANNEVRFEIETNRIIFSDYLALLNGSDPANPFNLSALASEDDDAKYLKIVDKEYKGKKEEIYNLDDYGLKLYQYYDEEEDNLQFFLPWSVLIEMFYASANVSAFADYRGVFYISDTSQIKSSTGGLTELGEFMSEVKVSYYSEEYADFNYGALCLSMDMSYGIGYANGFEDGFDSWASKNNLKDDLESTDPRTFANALNEVTDKYINDCHTYFMNSSPYSGFTNATYGYGSKIKDINQELYNSKQYRSLLVSDFKPYMEDGDTAYISFDSFQFDKQDCYSHGAKIANDDTSTMQLISYANKQIKRDNSPIKNVVLDMSCNGGGEYDSFIFTISWMLGECKTVVRDHISGSEGYTTYKADVNFDGKYDENDTVSDLNLYLLEGLGTFSGGNYTAYQLKNSGKVTILGQKSGGGSNIVLQRVTANGCMYHLSGRYEMCVDNNGTYETVEPGAVPDTELDYDKIHSRNYLKENYIK